MRVKRRSALLNISEWMMFYRSNEVMALADYANVSAFSKRYVLISL